MINTVIVDDEINNIDTLKKIISELCPDINIIGEAENIDSAYKLIKKLQPDLVLLDIEMPHGSGFDLLEKLKPFSFEVIFITAHNQFAIKAFKYNSIDYLLKPIDEQELVNAMEKACTKIKNRFTNANLIQFLNELKQQQVNTKIGLPTLEGFIFIEPSEIIRCEADGAYTHIYYSSNKKLVVSKNLKELGPFLNDKIFCRVHHSHIINLNFVKKYFRGKGGEIEMEDGTKVEVSSRRKNEFLEMYRLVNGKTP